MSLDEKIRPSDSEVKTAPPKRKIVVRVNGRIMVFDSMEQYFRMRTAKEKTTDLYKMFEQETAYGIKKPDYLA